MSKSTVNVQLTNRNIVLKSESQTTLRQIARSILAVKNEKLLRELAAGMIVNGDKVIKIIITAAESDQSGVEVL